MLTPRVGRHHKEVSWSLQRLVQGDGAPVLQDQTAFRRKFDPPERLPKPGAGRELKVVMDRATGPGDFEVDRHKHRPGGAEGETLRRPQRVLRAL